jgi:hypothetical protein
MPVFLYNHLLLALAKMLVADARIESLPPLGVIELTSPLEHVQGIDVHDHRIWVSSVDRHSRKGFLRIFDLRSGRLLRETEVQDGERFHPGGVSLDGRSVWVPVAEYRANSTSVIQRRNRETLALEASFPVADHIGCIARAGAHLAGGNWDSRILYRWTRDGRETGRVTNASGVAFQDLKAYGAGLLIGGGLVDKREGAVAVVDPANGQARQRWSAGRTDRGVLLTQEGLALVRGRLYLLPEDGRGRLFIYRWKR